MKTSAEPTRHTPRVLIVDDEEDARWAVAAALKSEGCVTMEAEDGQRALDVIRRQTVDLLLVDMVMPGMGGMALIGEARKIAPQAPVIMLTAYASTASAVEAMRNGACDFLAKPFDNQELRSRVRDALRARRPRTAAPGRPPRGAPSDTPLRERMGESDRVRKLVEDVELVAPTDFSVLILGETGAGKEVVAREIHHLSRRADGPWVPVDCGSIPSSLIESELFGHEKGAFTGAVDSKAGKFEVAAGGTLFLDEIGNLPLSVQPNMLRALQERRISRVGSSRPIDVDIRVIAASNQNLADTVAAREFRRDLYYRLQEFTLVIPSLRERKGDIPCLAGQFLEDAAAELGRRVDGFTAEALGLLLSYDWPGNVRELRNVIRRAALMADGAVKAEDISISRRAADAGGPGTAVPPSASDTPPLREVSRRAIVQVETVVIIRTLQEAHGNKAEAARRLQINYKTLLTKIKQYGIG